MQRTQNKHNSPSRLAVFATIGVILLLAALLGRAVGEKLEENKRNADAAMSSLVESSKTAGNSLRARRR